MSIVGDEAVADDIVALVGDIDYKIGYKPALSSAKDFILMVMEPEPLKINLKMPTQEGKEAQTMAIEVKVTASDNAAYGVEESKLKFDITATEVMLGEGAVVAAGALVLQNSLDPKTGKTNTITVFKQNRAALASNPIMNSVFAKLKQYME